VHDVPRSRHRQRVHQPLDEIPAVQHPREEDVLVARGEILAQHVHDAGLHHAPRALADDGRRHAPQLVGLHPGARGDPLGEQRRDRAFADAGRFTEEEQMLHGRRGYHRVGSTPFCATFR
jgi:hypothetical protein